MSMLGGIQPGRLRSYLVDALEDGPGNDGLIQRFQLLVWPDTESAWMYVDRPPDADSEERAAQVFRMLVKLNAENPKRLRFAPEAQELFADWLKELEEKVRGNELHPALISHLSKYRKLMPALSLLFEMAAQAAGDGDAETVSLLHARMAAAWCDYLESHARRVYSCIVTPQLRAARELADKIKKRKMGANGFFSCRDVYLKAWSGLDTPEAVKLAAAEWVAPQDDPTETAIPAIPPGVRLIDWKLKKPPVAIETCAVVTDTALFADSTLAQLGMALTQPRRWVGWSVPQLIDRLAQVGVVVTLEPSAKV